MAGTRAQLPIQLRDPLGDTRSGVSVALTHRAGGGAVTHYSAETGGTSSTAAIGPSDANGLFLDRWVPEGSYNAALSGGGITPVTVAVEVVRGDSVNNLANAVIASAQYANGAITTAKIPDNAITTAKLGAAAITEPKLATDAIATAAIATNAVTSAKLAPLAVTTAKYAADTITQIKLQSNSVSTAKLIDSGVTTTKVVDASMNSSKFAVNAVTTAKFADGTTSSDHYADNTITSDRFDSTVIPLGMIIPYVGSATPGNPWLLCQGQQVSRTTYAALYALIGHTYGTDPGSNLFTLPDLRGRAPVGRNSLASAISGLGENEGFVGDGTGEEGFAARAPRHGHTIGGVAFTGGGHSHPLANKMDPGVGVDTIYSATYDRYDGNLTGTTTNATNHSHTISGPIGNKDAADAGQPTTNAQPYLVVNYLIKALP